MMAAKVGDAMAKQLDRVNNDPVHLRQIIAEQEQTIQRLREIIQSRRTTVLEPVATEWKQIGNRHYKNRTTGREAGTQVALAEILGKNASTVSRWASKGKIPTVTTPDGLLSVWLDEKKPGRQKKSRK